MARPGHGRGGIVVEGGLEGGELLIVVVTVDGDVGDERVQFAVAARAHRLLAL